ncbi:hypothetical protein [Siansivirga zeaxanthinifaciens]|uniref:Uncharacterized protein n=1 Tax=Siansivirga zeaxanthinifaciens CC-SAMT-1 TaxID=1454006 RepID=A0A0C5W8U3_9FLAO|nr:hypothetical protein [Siansivirga zeaxanthinifaciens]AJR03588.1 hypothetical protein AW14_08120 [Siansivirga zeaxanthinifaciens CC-SAMT-1]
MIYADKEKHSDILENSITYLENRGFENIKADLDGYETPKSYTKSGSDISITPDVVATKEGRKYYFDISLKSTKPRLLKSKWLFLNTLSKINASRFKVITVRGHYKYTQDMLDAVNLTQKHLIKI